jgi:hypothetical protein
METQCPCNSGKLFIECHGKDLAPKPAIIQTPTKPILRLDLAAGQVPREGFEGVDIWEGSKHVIDLQKYPWPWEDSSVDELHCSHYIEHIPMEFVLHGGKIKDALFAFFDECYRILKPDAVLTIICPCSRNDRAFQDPTHRRFIPAQTFYYFNEEWRKINKLDHYNVSCNFGLNVVPGITVELSLMHEEVQRRRIQESWNVVSDWHATLKSLKK